MKYLLLILLLTSCKKDNNITYYATGEKKAELYFDGNNRSTIVQYYKNGIIKSNGVVRENKKIGWWNYFDKSGKISSKKEFIHVDEKVYLNQKIYYNEGRIVSKKSDFFKVQFSDTVEVGKNIGDVIFKPIYSNKSKVKVLIYENNDYSETWSSNEKIKDTFYMPTNEDVWFGFNITRKGTNYIKGQIIEEDYEIDKDTLGYSLFVTNKYFIKKIFIK